MEKKTKIVLAAGGIGVLLLLANSANAKEQEDFVGGGGYMTGGGDGGDWLGNLLNALQPNQENPFQETNLNGSGNVFAYSREVALANGFSSESDPLFRAALLQTQLDAGNGAGTYAVSAPYANSAAGAQAQIANTMNQGANGSTRKSSGSGGTGQARVVDAAASKVRQTLKISTPSTIKTGFSGGGGGAR